MSCKLIPVWKNETVFIIGGGPSVTAQFSIPKEVVEDVKKQIRPMSVFSDYMTSLHSHYVIGINAAYLLGDWIDIVFFHDSVFFEAHKETLLKHPGLLMTCNNRFLNSPVERVEYIPKDRNKVLGIHTDSTKISWNYNSGAAAITLAAHLGAKKIVLLGFDMGGGPGKETHFHTEHKPYLNREIPFWKHLAGFPKIKEDADRMGIEIINCSPDSAIKEFEKKNIMEVLND